MFTDPIADYLTRVRNAQMAGLRVVDIPASNMKKAITKILHEKGYILNFKFEDTDNKQGNIKVALKYNTQTSLPAIKKLIRISKPGLRKYADSKTLPKVINGLGINNRRNLLPQIINGSKTHHSLTSEVSELLGLKSGTPVVLSYIDAVCTFLGSGGYDMNIDVGTSSLGTTSGHMRANLLSKIKPNIDLKSGYVMLLPIKNSALQFQTNMSGMINMNWLMSFVSDIFRDFNIEFNEKNFLNKIESWIEKTEPQKLIYHPYISEAGERGPFINSNAQASLLGLNSNHRFPEIVRSFIEGLCFAAKECYLAIGEIPKEIRLAGGGSQSDSIRTIFSNILQTNVRTSNRKEAGAAGAAMIGAMSLGIYDEWSKCMDEWVNPFLGELEYFDENYSNTYDRLFKIYLDSRSKISPIWEQLN